MQHSREIFRTTHGLVQGAFSPPRLEFAHGGQCLLPMVPELAVGRSCSKQIDFTPDPEQVCERRKGMLLYFAYMFRAGSATASSKA